MGGRPEVSERADRRWSGLPWWGSAIVGSVLILVMALPQFLRPAGPAPTNYAWHVAPDGEVSGGLIIDQVQFLQLTDAFSGDGPTELVVSPFSSRALGPWLAAALPVDAGTGLLVVNLASLVLGTFALAALAHDLTRRRDAVMWSVAVWSLAFPAFWYTGKPLIDAAVVGLVPLVLLASHRRHLVLGAVALAVAIWTKEAAAVLVLPLVASELMDRSAGSRRLWRSAAWIVVAVAAFATTGFLAGASNVTFAPWIPPSLDTVRQMMVNNLSGRGIVQYVLTAAPAVLALLWWVPRSRRAEHPDLEDPVVPYLIGIVVVLLLGAWSLWSALLDGRSVWMSLPFAAVLIGLWVDVTPLGQRAAELRRTLRRLALPALALGVVWVAAGVVLNSVWAEAPFERVESAPRFAVAPPEGTKPDREHLSGTGSADLPARATPYLVHFSSSEGAQIEGPDGAQPHSPVRSGTVMIDGASDEAASIATSGDWTVDLAPVDQAMPWEMLSALRGSGPTVLLIPGGLTRPVRVDASFAHDDDQLLVAGSCTLGECPPVDGSGIIAPGTEAIVVDAVGDWQLIPVWLTEPVTVEGI